MNNNNNNRREVGLIFNHDKTVNVKTPNKLNADTAPES